MRKLDEITDRNQVLLLILVVTSLVLFATVLALGISYHAALEGQRERLLESVQSEARLIEAMYRHEHHFANQLDSSHGDAAAATLNQLTEAHSHFAGFGDTGEYTLARAEQGQIVFLLSHRHFDLTQLLPIPLNGVLAEPMRRALAGQSGVLIGLDYRGEQVLAAHEPITGLAWGLVAKIDLAEIRAPFWRTGAIAGGISILLALAAGLAVGRTGNRLVRRIRENEGLYRSLVENIDLGITLIDADYQIRMINAAQGRMLRRPVDSFIGKHCFAEFEKRSTVCAHCPGTRAMRSGRPEEVETRGVLEDGSQIEVRIRAFPLQDDAGATTGFIEVIEDITERKRFEAHLAETRRQLQALMDNLPGLAYRCRNDADWTMELVSQGCLELTGYPSEALIFNRDRSYASLIHPDDRELVWLQVQEAIVAREPFSLEYRVVTADGEVRNVWEKGSAIFSADGDLQALEGFIMDVSSRKAAEDALRASEERLRRAVLDAPFPIMLHAEDGEVLLLSKAWCDISGYSLQEIPTISDWTECAYGERNPLVREFIEQLYGIRERIHDGEFEVMTKSGLTRTWDFSSAPLGRTADGRRTVISMASDVTERKEAEQALEKTVADLQRSNRELEQFAYVASHDLQEPLRMVGSYVQLLARRYRGRLDADADEFIDFAVEGATRMQRLINDLLAFGRVGRQNEPLAAVDCGRVLTTVQKNLERSIIESGATLEVAPLPQVLGVASQLTQVFQNLIANAIKFHGQKPPRIEIGATSKGDDYVFSVRDHGIGIEPQYFDKIFIIFQRLHGKKDYPGTGIGLAVTKKIIEHHGGRIWIESSPGAGTTFFFTLRGAK